jgi:hypothetical protein
LRYKVQTEDFFVEEQIPLSLGERGQFAVCRVCKQGVTTLSVRRQMARIPNVHQSAITFPVLKDKQAIAVQYATVQGQAPKRMAGPGFEAEFLGRTERPLTPADITANRFTLILCDLTDAETATIHTRARQATTFGLPNYFDRQRFGSLSPGRDHIAKLILQRDAEGAVRAYLSHHFVGDPQPVRKFKAFAARHWGDWDTLFDAAPSPSNFRSVLTYLRDHPPTDGDGMAQSAQPDQQAAVEHLPLGLPIAPVEPDRIPLPGPLAGGGARPSRDRAGSIDALPHPTQRFRARAPDCTAQPPGQVPRAGFSRRRICTGEKGRCCSSPRTSPSRRTSPTSFSRANAGLPCPLFCPEEVTRRCWSRRFCFKGMRLARTRDLRRLASYGCAITSGRKM